MNYEVDDAGRTKKVAAGAKNYADTAGLADPYAPDGRLAKVKLGNDLYDTREFHAPGTSTKYKLGTTIGGSERLRLEYSFSGTQNNGNLLGHSITNGGTTWTQTFTYDALNRLKTASEANQPGKTGYSRTYGHDRYGNRWVEQSLGITLIDVHEPTVESNFDPTTNRIQLQGSDFDEAGNQTFYTPYNLLYDAENRNTEMNGNGKITFVYDGDGRRVKKTWEPSSGPANVQLRGGEMSSVQASGALMFCSPVCVRAESAGSRLLTTTASKTALKRRPLFVTRHP